MKYEKWTFTTVPNIKLLNWRNPILQTIYLRISHYANHNDECFPSQATLAKNCNISINSVKKYLKELEDMWILNKQARFKNNEQITSVYQMMIGGVSPDDTPVSPDAYRTKTTKLNINNTRKEELTELVNKWNEIELPVDKQLPKTRKTTDSLLRIYTTKRKEFEITEIKEWINSYCEEIIWRQQNNSFANHRFTLWEFLKQGNWLEKYINL